MLARPVRVSRSVVISSAMAPRALASMLPVLAPRTVSRRIDDRTRVSVGADGATVFGAGSSSVFALLDQLAADVAANPSALASGLTALDGRMGTVLNALTDVGVRTNQVEQAQRAATDKALDLRSTLSGVEDIDLPSVIIDMQLQQSTYQAALSATAKVIQPTLMDFLR